ncbi:hypothetical protein TNCV_1575741 [Trichonephila clavipes]|nr:hypothetical protein TNCV_1575741 [Trichonephila clavipes]
MFWAPSWILQRVRTWRQSDFVLPKILPPPVMRGVYVTLLIDTPPLLTSTPTEDLTCSSTLCTAGLQRHMDRAHDTSATSPCP